MSASPNVTSSRSGLFLVAAWALFLLSFPAGIGVGFILARGQDPAGRGIAEALGVLAGLLFSALTAAFISYLTIRRIPHGLGKLLSSLPWVILTTGGWIMLFTRFGDQLLDHLGR